MELSNRRREMYNEELSQIEYLETSEDTGLAFIDTGYIPKRSDIIVKSRIWIKSNNSTKLFSVFASESNDDYKCIRYQVATPKSLGVVGTVPNHMRAIYRDFSYDTVVDTEINGMTNEFINNGTVNLLADKVQGDLMTTLRLFSYESNKLFSCRIYYFQLYEGEELILDLIPVRKGKRGYMYDKVSGRLLGNSGNGKFILGKDIK